MGFARDQLVKADCSMCTIRQPGMRMHKNFASGQILGFVHPRASRRERGHGHSIGEGGES
jgi:hypothetical protein